MKKIRLEYKVLLILAFLLSIVVFKIVDRAMENINKITSEYAFLEKSTEVNGKITNIFVEHGIYATINDSLKYFIKDSDNYLYKKPNIGSYLIKGNLFQKKAGSDTIIIYDGKISFYFLHGGFINR